MDRKRSLYLLLFSIIIGALVPALGSPGEAAAAWSASPAVSAGEEHTVGLKSDGTVLHSGFDWMGGTGHDATCNWCDVSGWTGIQQICAGRFHTVGLKFDGTAVVVGHDNNYDQCDVAGWADLQQVSAGEFHTVGLKSDGTVVATGWDRDGACEVGGWTDIVQVSAGYCHTLGLKPDGTVVAAGDNGDGECSVETWADIVQVSGGCSYSLGLKSDGTVEATGHNNHDQCEVGTWTEMQQVSAGGYHTIGLKSDGTVVAIGDNDFGQCDVGGWSDVQQVAAGYVHTVGLRSDGTVVATGPGSLDWNLIVDVTPPAAVTDLAAIDSTADSISLSWTAPGDDGDVGTAAQYDIRYSEVQPGIGEEAAWWAGAHEVEEVPVPLPVGEGQECTVDGLTANTGYFLALKTLDEACNESAMSNIVAKKTLGLAEIAVSAGDEHTVGLKSDGTVLHRGFDWLGGTGHDTVFNCCDVSGWTDIQQICAGRFHTVGLRSDGTVVAAGEYREGQCDVTGWADVQQVSAGDWHTVGLKSDGTVVAAGDNGDGQCEVAGWTDIQQVSAGYWHTVGLKSDGTVVAAGDNGDDRCDVEAWTDIIQVSGGCRHTVGLKSDGTVVATGHNYHDQCEVASWTGIQQVSAGGYHTVGLKSDGTVVAIGHNDFGQCGVGGWSDVQQVAAGYVHTVGLGSDDTVVATGPGSLNWDLKLAADFTATPVSGDGPLTVAFTDLSTSCDGIVSWLWDFGDGATSTEQNPTHEYLENGTYTVSLTVNEADGDSDTRTKAGYITVWSPVPTADFTATPVSGDEPLTVDFTDLSTSHGGIVSWLWEFGDGATSAEQNPTHEYGQDGEYTVTLTVREGDGDEDVEEKVGYISVWDPEPVLAFSATPLSGDEPLMVAFTDLSTSHDGIVSWLWDFGDGATSEEQNPTHEYEQEGKYSVILCVWEDDGD